MEQTSLQNCARVRRHPLGVPAARTSKTGGRYPLYFSRHLDNGARLGRGARLPPLFAHAVFSAGALSRLQPRPASSGRGTLGYSM